MADRFTDQNGPREHTAPELEDYEDLKDLRAAKAAERDAPTIPLEEAKRKLGF